MELTDFPSITFDKIRYADTDRQGHVNNAVFSSFLETERVEILYNQALPILSKDGSFVIASLELTFLQELRWPGQVDIGTGLLKIGTSSITLSQMLFQDGKVAAEAKTVIVQISIESGKSLPLSSDARTHLQGFLLNQS